MWGAPPPAAMGAGGMGRDTFETFRLSRFVKIFAIIDTVFLFLYGISTSIICFVLALFAMAGVYGAIKLRKHLLILYVVCLALEIGFRYFYFFFFLYFYFCDPNCISGCLCFCFCLLYRCYLIYIAKDSAIDVILFVIMILIDIFVLRCTIQLYKAIGQLTPQQVETLIQLNNRCF